MTSYCNCCHVLTVCHAKLAAAETAVYLGQLLCMQPATKITGLRKRTFPTYPSILRVQLAAAWLSWINVEARKQAQHCCEQAGVVVEENRQQCD